MQTLIPISNTNTLWSVYDFNNIIASGGAAAEADRNDDFEEQIWGVTNPTGLSEITQITINTRGMTADGVNTFTVRANVDGTWTSTDTVSLGDMSYVDDSVVITGSWVPGSYFEVGVAAGSVSAGADPHSLDSLSVVVSGVPSTPTASGIEISRPRGIPASVWNENTYTNINEDILNPASGNGSIVRASGLDQGAEQIWLMDAFSELTGLDKITFNILHGESGSITDKNAYVRFYIDQEWTDIQNISFSGDVAWSGLSINGPFQVSDFAAWRIGITAPLSIDGSSAYIIDNMYVQGSGSDQNWLYDTDVLRPSGNVTQEWYDYDYVNVDDDVLEPQSNNNSNLFFGAKVDIYNQYDEQVWNFKDIVKNFMFITNVEIWVHSVANRYWNGPQMTVRTKINDVWSPSGLINPTDSVASWQSFSQSGLWSIADLDTLEVGVSTQNGIPHGSEGSISVVYALVSGVIPYQADDPDPDIGYVVGGGRCCRCDGIRIPASGACCYNTGAYNCIDWISEDDCLAAHPNGSWSEGSGCNEAGFVCPICCGCEPGGCTTSTSTSTTSTTSTTTTTTTTTTTAEPECCGWNGDASITFTEDGGSCAFTRSMTFTEIAPSSLWRFDGVLGCGDPFSADISCNSISPIPAGSGNPGIPAQDNTYYYYSMSEIDHPCVGSITSNLSQPSGDCTTSDFSLEFEIEFTDGDSCECCGTDCIVPNQDVGGFEIGDWGKVSGCASTTGNAYELINNQNSDPIYYDSFDETFVTRGPNLLGSNPEDLEMGMTSTSSSFIEATGAVLYLRGRLKDTEGDIQNKSLTFVVSNLTDVESIEMTGYYEDSGDCGIGGFVTIERRLTLTGNSQSKTSWDGAHIVMSANAPKGSTFQISNIKICLEE